MDKEARIMRIIRHEAAALAIDLRHNKSTHKYHVSERNRNVRYTVHSYIDNMRRFYSVNK